MNTSHDGSPDDFGAGIAELSAGRVHYREIGAGDPVVFVHGWGVNGTLWDGAARVLAAHGYRCILPDLPFGSHREPFAPDADLSPPGAARIVSEFLGTVTPAGATLVANDSGGAVCQVLVTTDPSYVDRLVLTNCDCLEIFPPGIFKLLVKLVRLPGGANVIINSLRFRANQRSPLAFGALTSGRIPDETLDSWTRPPIEDKAIRRDSRKFASGMDPEVTLAAAEKLGNVEVPVLLIWGDADRFFTVERGERLAKLFKDARLVRVQGARTFVSLDEPQRVGDEIAAFAGSTEPGKAGNPAVSRTS